MASLGQEVALQRHLRGKCSVFTIEELNTGFKHSDGGDHVARTTGLLIAGNTYEIVTLEVGPVEGIWKVRSFDLIRVFNVLLRFFKDLLEVLSLSKRFSLGKIQRMLVFKAFHLNLGVGKRFPGLI